MSKRNAPPAIAALTILMLFLPLTLNAGHRRRVLAVSPSPQPLAISFLGTSGVVNAGSIVARGRRRAGSSTQTILLRIGEASRESSGTATLRAFLETPDSGAAIRIDGVTLTAGPRIIRRHAPIGIAVAHRLEIEVPVTAAEGAFQMSIGWEVTTD